MTLTVQAIIMAGGEGVRLRPLTAHTPKPLVPLLGEPVMGYALKLLRRHGCGRIGATLWYMPEKIREAFGDGKGYGVRLQYYEEEVPMGTAGSMKLAQKDLDGPFFVLSGDGLTDCDLTAAMRFHREKKALATLVLKRVNVPLPYGVVLADPAGKITRFIEKPTWSRVFSDLVNTGVYILEPEIFDYIPDEGMPDFGKDIFPGLLARGLPLFGYETDGYWCDVGDQRAYMQAQRDLLEGKVKLPCRAGADPAARIDPAAVIEGPCRIGRNAAIGPGARVSHAVIGENCVVGRGAVVENACLWDGAAVLEKARATGCVLCDGAVARKGAEIGDGCALGSGAEAGAYALLRPGVKVGPNLKAAPGAVAAGHILSGDSCAPQWTGRGAECHSPESVCALCEAFARVTSPQRVIVGEEDDASCAVLAAGSLAACGVKALWAGTVTEPMLRVLIRALRMDGGVYASGQTLRFLNRAGAPLTARQSSAMDGCVLRQDLLPAFTRPGTVVRLTGAEDIYLSRILPEGNEKPLWSPVAVCCGEPALRRLSQEALQRLGAKNVRFEPGADAPLRPGETGLSLSGKGDGLAVFAEGKTLSPEENTLLLLALCEKKQGVLYDLPGVPRAAERIAALRPPDESGGCVWQRMILEDGLAAALLLCDALKDGPLSLLTDGLPETYILTRDVDCRLSDKGRILHTLCDQTRLPHTLGEGVRIRHDRGFATIVPDAHRSLVRVTSESGDSEFAKELCDFYFDEIRKITNV